MPTLGAVQNGRGDPTFQNVVSGGDWRPRRTGADFFLSPAMTERQLRCEHAVAFFHKMMAFGDWNFLPAMPIDIAILPKNGIQAGFVEWDVLPCMPEQLFKLIALEH